MSIGNEFHILGPCKNIENFLSRLAAIVQKLTNRTSFSVACTLIDNDTRHYKGQNVVLVSPQKILTTSSVTVVRSGAGGLEVLLEALHLHKGGEGNPAKGETHHWKTESKQWG